MRRTLVGLVLAGTLLVGCSSSDEPATTKSACGKLKTYASSVKNDDSASLLRSSGDDVLSEVRDLPDAAFITAVRTYVAGTQEAAKDTEKTAADAAKAEINKVCGADTIG